MDRLLDQGKSVVSSGVCAQLRTVVGLRCFLKIPETL